MSITANTVNTPSLEELAARLTELERHNARMREELATVRADRAAATNHQMVSAQTTERDERGDPDRQTGARRASRRHLMRTALGVAAAAVGTGALVEAQRGAALASGIERGAALGNGVVGPTRFLSTQPTVPAVSARGQNGAFAISANADRRAVYANSTSGPTLAINCEFGAGISTEGQSGGPGIEAGSNNGYGGVFSGGAGQLWLTLGGPTHPAKGFAGVLYADSSGRLWFCKESGNPARWVQLA